MKTWTANFTTKVEKLQGEQPCFLMTIEYGLLGYMIKLTNADKNIVLGVDTYYPYLVKLDTISKSIEPQDVIASIPNGSLTLMRNSTTDLLLSNAIKNHEIKIWQFFDGLTDADKISIGTFSIEGIAEATLSAIILNFRSRESELTELPLTKFNKINYPGLLDENINQSIPFILGDISDLPLSDPSAPRNYVRSYIPSVVALFCIDKSNRKFMAHKLPNDGVQTQTIDWVYKLENDKYSLLESDNAQTKNFVVDLSGNELKVTVNEANAINAGDRRVIRLMANKVGSGNTCSSFKDATDYDCTVRAILKGSGFPPIETTLELTFGKELSLPIKNADLFFKQVGIAVYSEGYAELVSFRYGRYGGLEWTLGNVGVGQNESYTAPNLDLDTYQLSDYYIKAVYSGVNKIGIDALYFYLGYYDQMDIEKSFQSVFSHRSIFYKPPPDAPGYPPPSLNIYKKEFLEAKVFTTNDLFCSAKGPNTVLQPGSISYPYDHPIYLITFILNRLFGFSLSTQIDGANFDLAYNYLNENGRLWHFGNQIKESATGIEVLANLLNQCFVKLFRGDDGKWKLFRTNRYGSETLVGFRDALKHDEATDPGMAYQMSDFKFYQNSEFYNKFSFDYHFNTGRNIFDYTLLKDRNNDAQLLASYQENGYVEIPYPFQQFDWHRQSPENNLFPLLRKFWRFPALIVEFDTSLVASKLELGDFIYINHKAQTWTSNLKNFQIIGLEQSGNTIHVKAIEIML